MNSVNLHILHVGCFSETDFEKRCPVLFSRTIWISATVPFYRATKIKDSALALHLLHNYRLYFLMWPLREKKITV